MDTNSLWNLIDELESFIQPTLTNVKSTQTTPRKRVFSKSYLVNRLCQPNEKSKRTCQHNSTKEKYKSDTKAAQHLKSQPNNSAAQNPTRNFKKKSELSIKNQSNPFHNKSEKKDISKNKKTVPANAFKSASNLKKEIQLPEDNTTHQKEIYISSARKKNTVNPKCSHNEECYKKEEPNFKENNPITKSPADRNVKWNKVLQSNISSNKSFSPDTNSQVKQLTNYWNNLLSTDQNLVLEDPRCQSDRARNFNLLFKRFSEYQNEKREWHFRKDDLARSRYISEKNECGNSSSVDFGSESSFDKEDMPKFINAMDSEDADFFKVASETAIKMLHTNNIKFNLFPISSLNKDYISPSVPIEGVIYQMAEKLLSNNRRISFCREPPRLESNIENHSNKLYSRLLTVTVTNDMQPSERNFELETNESTSRIVAIEGVNLKKVNEALQMLMMYKTYLLIRFIFNQVLLTLIRKETDKTFKNTFPVTTEEIFLSSPKHSSDNVEEGFFEDHDLTFWHRTTQLLLHTEMIVKNVLTSAFDNIVFYGPLIERFMQVTYQLLLSVLICRMVIMDVFKK